MATNGTQSSTSKGMAAYRAPSLLQPHRARQAIRDAHNGIIPPLLGFFSGLSSPPLTKVVAQLGYDMVWIDWEHSSCSVETMTQMVHDIQLISEGRTIALVRCPNHDHASIGYALDAGASVVLPQVDTVEQAKHIVSATKFGAKINGTRSAPPARFMPGLSDTCIDPSLTLWENLNEQAAVIIQIETLKGINNLDAILTECGDQIDAVWLGSLDARASMSLPGMVGAEPEWLEAVATYENTLRKHNMPMSGLAFGPPEITVKMAAGKAVVFTCADFFAVVTAGAVDLAEKRQWPARNFDQANSEWKRRQVNGVGTELKS